MKEHVMRFKQLLLAILLLPLSAPLLAGNGKAMMASWQVEGRKVAVIFFSNITDNPINVSFTVYGKNGELVEPTRYGGMINNNTQLAPRSSGFIEMQSTGSFNQGYIVVEWENLPGDDDAVAMLAHGYNIGANNSRLRSDYAVPINNGMPF